MTTASVFGGCWRIPADSDPPVHAVPAQAMRVSRCLRDEEAGSSNLPTPTQVKGHLPRRDVAFSYAVQQRSSATATSQAGSRAAGFRRHPRSFIHTDTMAGSSAWCTTSTSSWTRRRGGLNMAAATSVDPATATGVCSGRTRVASSTSPAYRVGLAFWSGSACG